MSGLAVPGDPGGPAERRMADLGLPFAPQSFPVEFLALGGLGPGVPVRAALSDFGPGLLAKVLGANETQEASLGLVYGERTDPQSAREMLAARLEPPAPAPAEPPPDHIPVPDSMREPRRRRPQRRAPAPTKSTPEAIGDFLLSRQGGALQREVLRGVFGLLRKR